MSELIGSSAELLKIARAETNLPISYCCDGEIGSPGGLLVGEASVVERFVIIEIEAIFLLVESRGTLSVKCRSKRRHLDATRNPQ
jgi:hypothetical protein